MKPFMKRRMARPSLSSWREAAVVAYRMKMAITEKDDESLSRAQKRLLRRIYNGRSVPIIADEKPFLTYKDASRYLHSLAPEARDAAYAEMRENAK